MSDFAQCSSCRYFDAKTKHCVPLEKKVAPEESCGLYAERGVAIPDDIAGLDKREVRCENCRFFESTSSQCELYLMLNRKLRASPFKLDPHVDKYGCCNANTPRHGTVSRDAFLYMEPAV